MKYALLFIALTFMRFFAWEHITKTPLHPLQYLLVGLALSLFYLLSLCSRSTFLFVTAYWSAASALIVLVGVYLSGAMHNRVHGSVAALAIAAYTRCCTRSSCRKVTRFSSARSCYSPRWARSC